MNRWTIPFFFCALFVSFRQCGLSQGDLLAMLCVFKSVAVFKCLRVVGMKGCGTSSKCYIAKYFHKAIEVSKRKRPQTWDNFSMTVLHLEIISSQCNGVHLQGWDWSPEARQTTCSVELTPYRKWREGRRHCGNMSSKQALSKPSWSAALDISPGAISGIKDVTRLTDNW